MSLAGRIALMLLLALPGCAPRGSMLPPEVQSQTGSGELEGFGEQPLWTASAGKGYRTRLRLTMQGSRLAKITIRIDQLMSGMAYGRVTVVDFSDPRDDPEIRARSFRVTRRQMEKLQLQIAETRLWRIHPQFFILADPQAICIDGVTMDFERVNTEGYRFSQANAQCGAPAKVLGVAATMIDLSGERRFEDWLD